MQANIWSLNKHNKIKLLLLSAQMQLGQETYAKSFTIKENHDHFCAVTLLKPDDSGIQAYIYTSPKPDTVSDPEKNYDIHLEYPQFFHNGFIENGYADASLRYEALSLKETLDTLVMHFDIDPLQQAV